MCFHIDGREYGTAAIRRFAAKVAVEGSHWLWMGAAGPYRTGTVAARDTGGDVRQVSAKRFAWAAAHGSIETGSRIVNTCGERLCCNPDHLRAYGPEETQDAAQAGSELAESVSRHAEIMRALVTGRRRHGR